MLSDILFSLALLVFGIFFIWFTFKTPKTTFKYTQLGGYGAGILGIIIGILYLLKALGLINW